MKKILDSHTSRREKKEQEKQYPVRWKRYRLLYFFLMVITVALGIACRELAPYLPQWMGAHGWDVLFEMLLYFFVAFLFAKMPAYAVGVFSFTAAVALEFSKFLQFPFLQQLRELPFVGGLFSGDISVQRLFCYCIGLALAVAADQLLKPARHPC